VAVEVAAVVPAFASSVPAVVPDSGVAATVAVSAGSADDDVAVAAVSGVGSVDVVGDVVTVSPKTGEEVADVVVTGAVVVAESGEGDGSGAASAGVVAAAASSACAATSVPTAMQAYAPAPRKQAAAVRRSHDQRAGDGAWPFLIAVVPDMGRTLGTSPSRDHCVVRNLDLCGVSQTFPRPGDCGE
jgi:hypothetical protein